MRLTQGRTIMEMDAGIGQFSRLLEADALYFCKVLIINTLQYLCFYLVITMLLGGNNYAFTWQYLCFQEVIAWLLVFETGVLMILFYFSY